MPQVAIVGRPNVGKSSLFNWLAGRRIAIVDPTAGVTRDRLMAPVKYGDRSIELIDTGGMGIQDIDNLTADVERQIDAAIEQAEVLLFVVDVRAGLVPLDEKVAERLRRVNKPVLLVANKADTPQLEPQAADFYRLGLGHVICVSAQQNRGREQLLHQILERLPEMGSTVADADNALKVAIVGRRNTGKSTFINCLARAERVIVSEVPGTTRDSVDVRFERDGKVLIAIDTAGVRHKGRIASDIDFYSMARAERSIRRADVVLMFHDVRMRISKVDKQLAGYVLENYKPAIFVVNKWDLAGDLATGTFADYLRKVYPSLDYVPIAFITATTGKNVYAVLNLARNLTKQASARVSTGTLNQVVRHALAEQPPPMRQNRRPKVNYATQVATNPPTIVLFTNGPELFDNTYQRYLLKTFRDHLPFGEVPIKLYLRDKHRGEEAPEAAVEVAEPKHPVKKAMKPGAIRRKARLTQGNANKKKGRRASELWEDV
jgi:GTP-binding protein